MKHLRLLLILLPLWNLAEADHRDWTKFPAIVEADTTNDVYALSDIQGDDSRFPVLLEAYGLIELILHIQRGGERETVTALEMDGKQILWTGKKPAYET
ncbi:MAG: hypothetical protein AAF492_21865 [Verrucomicrobiota bacterium]